MKKTNVRLSALFVVFLMLASVTLHAQSKFVKHLQGYNDQPYHFGFVLGFDQMLFSIKPVNNLYSYKIWGGGTVNNPNAETEIPDMNSDDYYRVKSLTANSSPGFSVGILGNLRLQKYLDLRFIPTIAFGSRKLVYEIAKSSQFFTPSQKGDTTFFVNKQLNSTYLIFPLLLKYRSWRSNNVGAYFIGGVSYSIDMAAAKRIHQSANNGVVKTLTHDAQVQMGAGFDFYTNYFKLGIEAKMLYGLKNLIINEGDIYSGSINTLHSKVFMLSFTFE